MLNALLSRFLRPAAMPVRFALRPYHQRWEDATSRFIETDSSCGKVRNQKTKPKRTKP